MSVHESKQRTNQILISLALVALLAVGLWLRWRFIQTVQLYPDEFVTLLAIKMIGLKGWPVMPSGLFFEHGLLFSYLGSLASFFGSPRLAVRYASLFCGGLTLVLTFWIGRRWFSPAVGFIATAGLAIAPAAIHWSGRARMYALLQLLVLLVLWLTYEGISQNKARLRWVALLLYLGATLTHFVSVALTPPLVLATIVLRWLYRKKAGKQPESLRRSPRAPHPPTSQTPNRWARQPGLWLEAIALAGILVVAFLVKRAGQPKGIEALQPATGAALTGLAQVFDIYSDFSFNLIAGWQAIAPFYLTLPALFFLPFALVAAGSSLMAILNRRVGRSTNDESTNDAPPQRHVSARQVRATGQSDSSPPPPLPTSPTLFLSLVLLTTTLEMILLVSPDRRDDKYLFMLLPAFFLLGAQGMAMIWDWALIFWHQRSAVSSQQSESDLELPFHSSQPSAIHYSLFTIHYSQFTIHSSSPIFALFVAGLILMFTRSNVRALLANTGDDYDSAFAYVQEHWQEGDTILTGTPSAAVFYLGRNDFYSVQRRGGYDYRILTVNNRLVDRWLASPAIRTEAALHQTLANHNVWLVLERWGLQREYYDLPFQQQLLAQTEHVTGAQGIFILRSKPNPRPIALEPAHLVQAVFGNMVQLTGYTVEPEQVGPGQALRLTLYWQALAPIPDDYTVFVHLRQPDGGNVAQADHRPLGSLYPTSLWPVGETIRESSDLFLSSDLPPGDYDLWAGLYLLETGERLPVQNDTSGENAVRLGVLTVSE